MHCIAGWQKFRHDKHIFVVTKDMFVVTKVSLSRQNFCHDKYLLWRNFGHDKNRFVLAEVLLQQAYFCCDKRHVLLQQTKVLSWQKLYLWLLPPSRMGEESSDGRGILGNWCVAAQQLQQGGLQQ